MQIKTLTQGANPYDQKKVDRVGKPDQGSQAAKSGKAASDKISFSETATLAGNAARTANASSGTRADRIAELKAKVANGTYKPDTQKIAQNLVRDDLDLIIK